MDEIAARGDVLSIPKDAGESTRPDLVEVFKTAQIKIFRSEPIAALVWEQDQTLQNYQILVDETNVRQRFSA